MFYDKIEFNKGQFFSNESFSKFELAKEKSDFSNTVYIRKIFEDRGKIVIGSWRQVKNKSEAFGFCQNVGEELNEKICNGWMQNLKEIKKWATR